MANSSRFGFGDVVLVGFVIRTMGKLSAADAKALREVIGAVIG